MLKRSAILSSCLLLLLLFPIVSLAAGFKYDFDSGTQGWTGKELDDQGNYAKSTVSHETSQVADGTGSLKVTFEPHQKYVKYQVLAPVEGVKANQTYTYKVFIPNDVNLKAIQLFIQYSESWTWKDKWIDQFEKGKWITISYTIPSEVVDPVKVFGIQFELNAPIASAVSVYLDSVDDGSGGSSSSDSTTTESPKTGVPSVIPYVILAGVSGTILYINKRKK
jgi:hypothetical protein